MKEGFVKDYKYEMIFQYLRGGARLASVQSRRYRAAARPHCDTVISDNSSVF